MTQKKQKGEKTTALVVGKKMHEPVVLRPRAGAPTPEQRIEKVRGYLDVMDALELQKSIGKVLIGEQLLNLKDELGHGSFKEAFVSRMERPSFSYRTAARAMQDANRVRKLLLKSGNVSLIEIFNLPPSQLTLTQRKSLGTLVEQAMGTGAPKQLTDGKSPASGKAAELQAHEAVWDDLCKRIVLAAVHHKTWKFLDAGKRKQVRDTFKSALETIPE